LPFGLFSPQFTIKLLEENDGFYSKIKLFGQKMESNGNNFFGVFPQINKIFINEFHQNK